MLIVVVAQDIIQGREKKKRPTQRTLQLPVPGSAFHPTRVYFAVLQEDHEAMRKNRNIDRKQEVRGAHENNQGFGGFSEVADRNVQHRLSATMFVRGKRSGEVTQPRLIR